MKVVYTTNVNVNEVFRALLKCSDDTVIYSGILYTNVPYQSMYTVYIP